MTRICFVCLGNICRSPLAAGVFKHLVQLAGLEAEFHIESAGMGEWHVGELADPRSRRTAQARGIRLTDTAQQFKRSDFERFDVLIAVDEDNADALRRLAPTPRERAKVRLLREFDPEADGDLDVPDPYYGGMPEFERVYEMVERSSRDLLHWLTRPTK